MTVLLIAGDIPFNKLNNPTVRRIVNRYINRVIPDESTLRKNYVRGKIDSTIEEIRLRISNDYICVAFDETNDAEGRYVACLIVF